MKLRVDFSELWEKVRQMGTFEASFNLEEYVSPELQLDKELSSTAGLDITLDDLELDHGVLSVKGRQVLLFIPDQGNLIEEVLAGKAEGRKFHVADCKTLERMRREKRFSRYKATYNTSGKFKVYGVYQVTGQSIEGEAELKVCKNCLDYLNYKGYHEETPQGRRKIYKEFNISEFLSEYSTLFRSMPERANFVEKGGYSENWKDVSFEYRESVNFCCEQCGVDLKEYKHLLHTHHINGNKRDNRKENLKALCIDCHRKQPHHDYMRVTHENMVLINRLRRQQGLLSPTSWEDVRNMADKALDGLLRFYEKEGQPLPEIGYELIGTNGTTVAQLEIAWPSKKKGVAIKKDDIMAANRLGWRVMSLGQALKEINASKV